MAIVSSVLALLQAQHVLVSLSLVLAMMAFKPLISRLLPPTGAPPFFTGYYGLDAPRFSKRRAEFLRQGKHDSFGRQFSFWYGPNHVVAVSGASARSTFLTAQGLDPLSGHLAILGSVLNIDSLSNRFVRLVMLMFKRIRQDEHMAENLPHLVSDSDKYLKRQDFSKAVDPVDMIVGLVYQLTHRTVGIHDLADDHQLLAKTRRMYKPLEESSPFDIWFPLLPTPSKLKKLLAYTRLHWLTQSIITKRRSSGRPSKDGLQIMMDHGCGDAVISMTITGAIIAGVFNTSLTAAWNLCYLAQNPMWMSRIRAEVDEAIEKHRQLEIDDTSDILQRLTLKDWEAGFPQLNCALKETLRFTMAGAIVRKNISNKSIPIRDTDLAIPKNSLVVYLSEDAHMDPGLYSAPLEWNPSRHDKIKATDKQEPHSFLGWGSGNHPCPGIRFANLNMMVTTVVFLAYYDFERCDAMGNATREPLPDLAFDCVGAGRPSKSVYIKAKPRCIKTMLWRSSS